MDALGTGDLYIDSLKDLAFDLPKDDVGSRVNYAIQMVVDSGRQVLVVHHNRKDQGGSKDLKALSDVYGSRWLTSGMGSVISLSGEPGDPLVTLRHLKQPAEDIGPMKVLHEHATGTSTVGGGVDLLTLISRQGEITVKDAAKALFETTKPADAQIERARRTLTKEVEKGNLRKVDGMPTTWVPSITIKNKEKRK